MSSSGGVITSTQSNMYFSGITHMISNQGSMGGAIVSTGSVVSISGDITTTRQTVEVAFISKIVVSRLKEYMFRVSSATTLRCCRVEESMPLVQPTLCISEVPFTSLTTVQKKEAGLTLK